MKRLKRYNYAPKRGFKRGGKNVVGDIFGRSECCRMTLISQKCIPLDTALKPTIVTTLVKYVLVIANV